MSEFKIRNAFTRRRAGREALVRALKITGRELLLTRGCLSVARMHRLALADRNVELCAALGDVIGILASIGGWLRAEDQALLRNARRVHGGS